MHVHNSLDLHTMPGKPTHVAWAQMLRKLKELDKKVTNLKQENQDLWIEAQESDIKSALLEAELNELKLQLKKKQLELDTLSSRKIPIKVTPRSDHEDEILSFYKRNNIPRPSFD